MIRMLGNIGLIAAPIMVFVAGIRIVRPTERAVVEFLGKYQKYGNKGFNWVCPGIQKLVRVNVTEQMVDAKKQNIITKDNLNAEVDAQVYFKVRDDENSVKSSQYAVNNYKWQIVNLARTTLRNIIGNLPFNEANSDRDKINIKLMADLKKETHGWGIDIVRTELKEIDPPTDVQAAMNQVIKAENERIAAKDFATAQETKADGTKRAEIKKAEGDRQARILAAEGKKQARVLEAEGVAKSVQLENEAICKYFKDKAITYKQLDVTRDSLMNNSKILITQKGIDPVIVLGDNAGKPFPLSNGKK